MPLEDGGAAFRSRGGAEASDKRNSAYEAIQAKIRAAAEANKKTSAGGAHIDDDEYPFGGENPGATNTNSVAEAET